MRWLDTPANSHAVCCPNPTHGGTRLHIFRSNRHNYRVVDPPSVCLSSKHSTVNRWQHFAAPPSKNPGANQRGCVKGSVGQCWSGSGDLTIGAPFASMPAVRVHSAAGTRYRRSDTPVVSRLDSLAQIASRFQAINSAVWLEALQVGSSAPPAIGDSVTVCSGCLSPRGTQRWQSVDNRVYNLDGAHSDSSVLDSASRACRDRRRFAMTVLKLTADHLSVVNIAPNDWRSTEPTALV